MTAARSSMEEPALYYIPTTESQDSIHEQPETVSDELDNVELKCLNVKQLKALMKKHEIDPKTYLKKKEIIELLKKHNVLPEDYIEKTKRIINNKRSETTVSEQKHPKEPNPSDRVGNPKYEWLAKNRRNPRRVETTNESTGEVKIFPSIYKARQYLETKATKLIQHDGHTFHANQKDIPCQYKIKILDPITNKDLQLANKVSIIK